MGVSISVCARWARHMGVSTKNLTVRPVSTRQLLAQIHLHGLDAIRAKYAEVMDVDDTLHAHHEAKKKAPWSDDQIVDAVRMGPFVPFAVQAQILSRRGRGEASIDNLWWRVLRTQPSNVHGLSLAESRLVCSPGTPRVHLPVLRSRRSPKRYTRKCSSSLVLWSDAVGHLRPSVPKFLWEAIQAMAMFQGWLYHPDPPREAIIALMTRWVARHMDGEENT